MQPVNRESKTSVHFSVSYILAMPWQLDRAKAVDFQKALLDGGLDFGDTSFRGNNFRLTRHQPSNLQVNIESPAAQITGLHIISQEPQYELEAFSRDAAAVTQAYQKIHPAGQYQIIQCTAKIHHLYSCADHAFKYLWEQRLDQSPQDFRTLGQRPVAGGGLRLIMPPHAVGQEEPRSIEIRIESFLRESLKLLVETIFVWPKPRLLGTNDKFEPAGLLNCVEQYAVNEVWNFLTHPKESGE